MTCAEALERLHDALDARLGAAEVAALDAHVAGCDACRRARAELAAMRAAFRAMPAVRAPAGLREAVLVATSDAPRGRLLTLPRVLFPLGLAAALLVGAVVVARTRGERETAGVPHSSVDVERRSQDGFGSEKALRAAGERARIPSDESGASAADAAAPTPTATPEVALDRAARDEAEERAAKAPAAPAATPPAPSAPAPPPPGASKPAGEAKSRAKAEAAPVPTRLVVFRSEAEARAFLAAIEPQAARTWDADDSKPRRGDGATTGGEAAGGRAAAEPAPSADPEADDLQAAKAGIVRRVRLVGGAVVRGDAWLARAANAGVVDATGEQALAAGTPSPGALRGALDASRRRADDPARRLGDDAAPPKDARRRDAGADGPATPPSQPAAAAARAEPETVLVVIVEEISEPAPGGAR